MVLVTGKKRRISPITFILQSPLKEAESSIDACKRYALNAVILQSQKVGTLLHYLYL